MHCLSFSFRNSQLKLVEFAFIPSNIVSIIHFACVCVQAKLRACAFIFNLHNVRGVQGESGRHSIELSAGWNVFKSQ